MFRIFTLARTELQGMMTAIMLQNVAEVGDYSYD
jgi:hypothetical protein